jgi:hypothetical protein
MLREKTTEPTVNATQQSMLETAEPQPGKSPDYYEEGF